MTDFSALRSVACVALVFFVAGMAACLVCDLNSCCDEPGHEDSHDCACSCVIQGTLGMSAPQVSAHQGVGSELVVVPPRIPSIDPQSLFRPPRA